MSTPGLSAIAATAEAERLEAEAASFSQDVRRYIQRADNYLLGVVIFAISFMINRFADRGAS